MQRRSPYLQSCELMANFKPSGTKLPILLAIPVLVVFGVAAVWMLGPDDPDPPRPPGPPPEMNDPLSRPPDNTGTDPLTVDPGSIKRPTPGSGSPDSVEMADAMLNEAWNAMRSIRARLELKFKYAEYELDRGWTIGTVMRHPERLDGEHFKADDFVLSFPEGEEMIALVECSTAKGIRLPDGALSMRLNLQNGECEEGGTIYARNASGEVLLADEHYRWMSTMLQSAAVRHMLSHFQPDGEASSELFEYIREPFERTDLSSSSTGEIASFACRSVRGEPLAYPGVISIDYASEKITLSSVPSRDWMPLPKSAEDFSENYEWYMRWMAKRAIEIVRQEGHSREVTRQEFQYVEWYFTSSGVCPLDLNMIISKDDPLVVTLELRSSWGRQLPFKPVRYVAEPDKNRYGFEQD